MPTLPTNIEDIKTELAAAYADSSQNEDDLRTQICIAMVLVYILQSLNGADNPGYS